MLAGDSDELLGFFAGAEDGHAGDAAADHGDFVATMQTRAVLAILEDLVRQFGLVFDGAEAVFEKEVWDAGEEADGLDAMLLDVYKRQIQE